LPDPAIKIQSASYLYPGAAGCAIENVSLEVAQGEIAGSISVLGRSPAAVRRDGLVGVVPQHPGIERRFPVSARDTVLLPALRGLAPWKPATESVRSAANEAIERAGIADLADQPIGRLSGGELQRVLLARALALRPKILALDEPLVGVDAGGRAQFTKLLSELHKDLGLTILLISHDLRTIATGGSGCDRVACLNKTLHFHAAPSGITPEILAEVFHHDLADVFGDVHVDAHHASDCHTDHDHAGKLGGADGIA
jgi:ABC-type Mn2+/Zn2+ transport system ATPase subunit